jgi:hypothetical protein
VLSVGEKRNSIILLQARKMLVTISLIYVVNLSLSDVVLQTFSVKKGEGGEQNM